MFNHWPLNKTNSNNKIETQFMGGDISEWSARQGLICHYDERDQSQIVIVILNNSKNRRTHLSRSKNKMRINKNRGCGYNPGPRIKIRVRGGRHDDPD